MRGGAEDGNEVKKLKLKKKWVAHTLSEYSYISPAFS